MKAAAANALTLEVQNTEEELPAEEKVVLNLDDEEELIAEVPQAEMPLHISEVIEEKMAEDYVPNTHYDPTLDLSNYKLPPVELMEEHGSDKLKIDSEELERNKNQIIATLNNYSIEISKIKATIGPTVTLYEIVPAAGVRISKIKNLEDDIALSLAALGIRIIAPMPGKGTIGIEVPNTHKEVVSMRSLIASEKFQNSTADLPICLGKTISNEIYVADLAKMPHLLMAGATGQGKAVGINAILVSLLYKKHPSQLKFVMVDPKKSGVEFVRNTGETFSGKAAGRRGRYHYRYAQGGDHAERAVCGNGPTLRPAEEGAGAQHQRIQREVYRPQTKPEQWAQVLAVHSAGGR